MPGYGEIVSLNNEINTNPSETNTQMPITNPSPEKTQTPTNNTSSPQENSNNTDANNAYILFLYPKEARQIKEIIDNKLNTLDYEGSIIFHEYPDKTALQNIISQIKVPYEIEKISPNWLQQLIEVIFYNEIYNRRNRHFNANNNNDNNNI